jgi:hypothetical protein
MNITNVEITRVIAHEVVRASQMAERPPILSDHLVALDGHGKGLVAKRIVATVGSGSHCVDVTVSDATAGSPFNHATTMFDCNDAAFVKASQHLARALSTAQTVGTIRSGSALFVQGTCAADDRPSRFLTIIKADSDQGFFKQVQGESIDLRFVSDMLLGESQRLLKVAFFIENPECEQIPVGTAPVLRQPEEFCVKVFDHMMQNSGDGNAALYFYSTFLKCTLANDASRQTRDFYNIARDVIDEMPVPQQDKVELRGDLISYLRSNRATLSPRTFAKEVLPEAQQDVFVTRCKTAGITQAISKNLELLKNRLRRRSLRFSSQVTITASPEAIRESVRIHGQSKDGWTRLEIKGEIEETR